ncbi:ATP-binding protein [Actinomadura chibensis]|uniref:ATP-binding protein n=1 Tax=Actinomadura chibensis TaxID=392828 RepID=A0A5D0NYG4_9ACTN|nr:hypothetical protein [Actinomadura chibensis]TYB49547.1 hypothetical protein FXF69_10860 [Actinomadura chibensis]
MTKAATECGIPWSLEPGGCAAIPLPADESIAAVARAQVRTLLPALGLAVQDADDVAIMVSELATNVLQHATPRSGRSRAELWVYQRGSVLGGDELVVKAFDSLRQWRRPPERVGGMHEHGRGLEIIEILTAGRWGHHPTRSRLSTPVVRGKATWFAVPVTRTGHPRPLARRSAGTQSMRDLQAMLVQRGVQRLAPRNELGVAMLSAPGELTVWCETATFRWCSRSGETGRLPVTDITEVCEQLVRLYEGLSEGGDDRQ